MTFEAPILTVTHNGCTIEIHRDSDPLNPWTEWDCQPPVIALTADGFTRYGDGDDLAHPLDGLTDGQISRHWRKIADILNDDKHDKDARAEQAAYGGSLSYYRRDLFNQALITLRSYGSKHDYLDALASLWKMRGVTTLRTTANGYTQGSWAELLLVYTDKHATACGGNPTAAEKLESLKADANLWRQWAWGDVWGYVVTDPNGDEIDSCWGFFGDYDDEHMINEAKAMADNAKPAL